MDYVPGETWASAWKDMTVEQKEGTITQMRKYVDELRQLHHGTLFVLSLLDMWADEAIVFNPDQHVGALGFKPCWDLRISSSRTFGPFPDLQSFYNHLLGRVKMIAGESKALSLFEALTSLKSHSPPVVFSHSDLTARNVLINDGRISGIIDWEQSGWWPYWWESMKALYCTQLETDIENEEWRQFVKSCMTVSEEEHRINEEIRDIEGFPY